MLGALMNGAAVIIVDGFDARAIVDVIARHRLGWLLLMPGSIAPVVALLKQEATVAKGVKVCGAMADLVPTALIAELSGLLRAPYLNSFGSTETGLPPASAMLFPPGTIPTTLSKRQSALCDLRLLDPDGRDVADGEAGEGAIRGPTVFSGYGTPTRPTRVTSRTVGSAWAICSGETRTAATISWTGPNT